MQRLTCGDKVICVDNYGLQSILTQSKMYTIFRISKKCEVDSDQITIYGDDGCWYNLMSVRFIILKEYRAMKLKEIYEQI